MNKNTIAPKSRNYGIDLLRIVSMLMVVILHVLGQGGVLKNSWPLSSQYYVAWFLEIACYCAVNCYALISGYVGVDAKYKYSNIVYIWIQVVFYAVGIALVFALASPNIYLDSVWAGFTPVSKNLYWYFTAYFCIFFFIPFFNKAINALNDKQLRVTGISIFLLFSILQILIRKEIFYTNRGYSALWLALLYILGGIIKRTGFLSKLKSIWLGVIYLACIGLTLLEKCIVEYINTATDIEKTISNTLVSYISPTILLSGIVLLVLFSKIRVGNIGVKLISFFAPLSFGVYLIHVQKQVWTYLLKDRFIDFAEFNVVVMLAAVLGTALIIFFICILIDFVRDRIFKLLKIKELLQKMENKILGKIWD